MDVTTQKTTYFDGMSTIMQKISQNNVNKP